MFSGTSRDTGSTSQAVREERVFTESVLDAIPDVFYLFDTHGKIRRWNDRLAAVTGYTDEEIADMHPIDFVLEGDVETMLEAIATVVETGEPQTRESRFVTKDGETVPYRFSGSLVTNAAGTAGVIGTARDVSERRERERTLEALHDATRAMMTATSREAVCEIAADASKRVLGYPITVVRLLADDGGTLAPAAMTAETRDRIGERPAYSIHDTPAGDTYRAGESHVYDDVHALSAEYERGNARSALYTPLGRHGVISIADTRVGVFESADEQLANVLAANTEAALEHVEHEQRLRRREAELRRHNARLEELASVVSHDLRNPINVIMGNAALARETGDVTYIEPIERAADRVNRLTSDLPTLARQGRTVSDRQRTPIAPLVADIWAVVGRESATLVLDEKLSEESSWETIDADPTRLQQLFENLLSNAIEHGGTGVVVTVGALPDASGFYVADDGPGIPVEKRERIFDHDYTTSDAGGARFEVRTDDDERRGDRSRSRY